MPQRSEQLLATVRRLLLAEKGNLRNVALASGIPYPTLTKITSGAVTDPRVSTVQALQDYFATRANAPLAATDASTH